MQNKKQQYFRLSNNISEYCSKSFKRWKMLLNKLLFLILQWDKIQNESYLKSWSPKSLNSQVVNLYTKQKIPGWFAARIRQDSSSFIIPLHYNWQTDSILIKGWYSNKYASFFTKRFQVWFLARYAIFFNSSLYFIFLVRIWNNVDVKGCKNKFFE